MINYEINKEYMDWLASKLDSVNLDNKFSNPDESISGFRMPNTIDQIGITAKCYLDKKNLINGTDNLSDAL